MTEKATKRTRLVLKGNDDLYAKREAIADINSDRKPTATSNAVPTAMEKKAKPVTKMNKTSTSEAGGAELKTATTSLEVNFILPVGKTLGQNIADTASKFDLEIEDILKAARSNTAQKFLSGVKAGKKPPRGKVAVGGASVRFSTVYSPEVAEQLHAWFDPLDVGTTRRAVKQALSHIFLEELRKIVNK